MCEMNCREHPVSSIQLHQSAILTELRHEKTRFLPMRKQRCRSASQLLVTAKLISAFVFATRIVQFLFFLNPNFKLLAIFCDCTGRFVSDFVGNHEDRFSHVAAQLIECQVEYAYA